MAMLNNQMVTSIVSTPQKMEMWSTTVLVGSDVSIFWGGAMTDTRLENQKVQQFIDRSNMVSHALMTDSWPLRGVPTTATKFDMYHKNRNKY